MTVAAATGALCGCCWCVQVNSGQQVFAARVSIGVLSLRCLFMRADTYRTGCVLLWPLSAVRRRHALLLLWRRRLRRLRLQHFRSFNDCHNTLCKSACAVLLSFCVLHPLLLQHTESCCQQASECCMLLLEGVCFSSTAKLPFCHSVNQQRVFG